MSYPPEHHVLRDLPFEMEQVDAVRARAYVQVVPATRQAGAVDPGAVMTAVDVLAGSLVGRVVAPDWMATAELALHLGAGAPSRGEVVAEAEVIRDGRTTVVLDARLRDAGGAEFGELVLTFVRLPRREGSIDLSAFPVVYGERTGFGDVDGLVASYGDAIGIEVVDGPAGECRLEVGPYVRNSFGAVNGGVVATLTQRAGRVLAESALGDAVPGRALRTTDVVVHYLTQGRVGPLVTRGRVVRASGGSVQARVELLDAGRSGDGGPVVVALGHVRSELVGT